jgi:hypothetical protein
MSWKKLSGQDELEVTFELRRLAERVADLVTTGATPVQPNDGPPERQTAGQLALIHAATLLHKMVDDLASQAVYEAGQLGLVTFPQLGEAAGITRQSARERWRHLIPEQHRRPGRRPARQPNLEPAPETAARLADQPAQPSASSGSAREQSPAELDLELGAPGIGQAVASGRSNSARSSAPGKTRIR